MPQAMIPPLFHVRNTVVVFQSIYVGLRRRNGLIEAMKMSQLASVFCFRFLFSRETSRVGFAL